MLAQPVGRVRVLAVKTAVLAAMLAALFTLFSAVDQVGRVGRGDPTAGRRRCRGVLRVLPGAVVHDADEKPARRRGLRHFDPGHGLGLAGPVHAAARREPGHSGGSPACSASRPWRLDVARVHAARSDRRTRAACAHGVGRGVCRSTRPNCNLGGRPEGAWPSADAACPRGHLLSSAAFRMGGHAGAVTRDVFGGLTVLYSSVLALLIGSIASAEERQLGTQEWQQLLPMASWKQWALKVGTAIGLSLLLGVALPAVILLKTTGAIHLTGLVRRARGAPDGDRSLRFVVFVVQPSRAAPARPPSPWSAITAVNMMRIAPPGQFVSARSRTWLCWPRSLDCSCGSPAATIALRSGAFSVSPSSYSSSGAALR